MNLNSVREGELKEVFDALEEAFAATGTDYHIIGAEIWRFLTMPQKQKTPQIQYLQGFRAI